MEIEAIDIHGVKNTFFIFENTLEYNQYINILVSDNEELTSEYFEFSVIQKNNIPKVQTMFAYGVKYKKKGLPEALIMYAKNHLKQDIYSSSITPIGNDHLSEDGKKVWKRLINNKKAELNKKLDRYKTI